MYLVTIINKDYSKSVAFQSVDRKTAEKWWKENSEDYTCHPKYLSMQIEYKEYSYFLCEIMPRKTSATLHTDVIRKLYKATQMNDGGSYIIQEMKCVDGEWIVATDTKSQLVYSNLKGYSLEVEDEDIWSIMGCFTAASRQDKKNIAKFKAHRNYFDNPNNADNPTWHEPSETINTNRIWTPYVDVPQL